MGRVRPLGGSVLPGEPREPVGAVRTGRRATTGMSEVRRLRLSDAADRPNALIRPELLPKSGAKG